MDTDYDIVINGGGMVGMTLACLLAKQAFKVAVIEAYLPTAITADAPYDLRVSAISRASQHALQACGAWDQALQSRIGSYEAMHVWDAEGNGEIHFDAADLGEPNLGHIVENRVLQFALLQAARQFDNLHIIAPAQLAAFSVANGEVRVTLENASILSARLLVGADGAHSSVRELAGINVDRNDYAQKGVVAVIKTSLPHQNTCWQRFMPTGPLAFLPLADGNCSIVWTLPADQADYKVLESLQLFNLHLADALDSRLGEVELVSQRAAFPLVGRQARHYVQEGLALIGDAAHTIHPLAGQGVNLGIKDAVELAQVLADERGRIGNFNVLRRYERARRGDNVLTQKAMEGFKVLFGNTLPPVKLLRNIGLNAVNALAPLKHELIRRAMGL